MAESELEKVEGREQRVPARWRSALKEIADAYVDRRLPAGDNIRPVRADVAKINFEHLDEYPDATGPLRDKSWDTSVCAWMGDHWEVLVDLITVDGERSDLVLHAKVFEFDGREEFAPDLIYVP